MKYDAIVVGGGQAGPSLAAFFAGQGQKVALAEGGKMGGSCVNYGCTPTKTMRAAARVAYQARRASDYGIHTGSVTVDFTQVMERVQQVVGASREGLTGWLENVDNLDLYWAYASFIGQENGLYQLQAGDAILEAERVYLNVGTRALIPPIAGLADVDYLTNIEIQTRLHELPEHLIILGGGYIGMEMGQIFRRLGSAVTILEHSERLLPREDEDVCSEATRIMQGEGVGVHANFEAERVSQDGKGYTVTGTVRHTGERLTISGSHLLVATGRVPNTDSLNLGAVGVETDKRGYIPTNGQLETNVPGIYALGDINKRGAFTHTSYHDYEIVRDNWQGANRSADGRTVPYAMYIDPPMGRVGMSEQEARASGRNILMMRHYAKQISRAKEDGELNGLVKLIVDADSEEILGATTFVMQGDDVIQVVSNYMATGASYKHMQQAVPVHPTISEYFPTWLGMLAPLEEIEPGAEATRP